MARAATGLIHHAYRAPGGFDAPQPGVFKASSVFFPSVAAMRSRDWKDRSAYTYGLHGTPTTYELEARLAHLESGTHCLLAPSGLAAMALVNLALLGTGDEVLFPDNGYSNNLALARSELKRWGITHQVYDPMDVSDLAKKISHRTQLVWLEAAGSVTLEFPDLVALVQLCKSRGVRCALDNTWGAGIAFNAFDLHARQTRRGGPSTANLSGPAPLGVDLTMHALTKYPNGSGDVLMGSVITRDAALFKLLQRTHERLGLGVAANDAEALLRGLPSIHLRYAAHDLAARELALWAQTQSAFVQVLHPALPGSPGHDHWKALCGDTTAHGSGSASSPGSAESWGQAAGLLSVVVDPRFDQSQVDHFCDALTLFRLGYSWGGPISLVVPYELAQMRVQWPAHLKRGTVVRLAIGLEHVDDLRADLAQAVAKAFGT